MNNKVTNFMTLNPREKQQSQYDLGIEATLPGKLVFVEGKNFFGMELGYKEGTTVIAYNPEMDVMAKTDSGFKATGETYKKYTVARYDSNVPTNIKSFLAELNSKEAGWGGQENIFGSPQGIDSNISKEEIIAIAKKYVN